MRAEIGSEFWAVPTTGENGLFPADTRWFRSGRSALTAILRENGFRKAALPEWCCDSMIVPFLEAGIQVVFYPSFGSPAGTGADVALVMDYFGWDRGGDASGFSGTVIRDLTHSILRPEQSAGDYYFGSLRKWAGFWTGGFAWGFRSAPVMDSSEDSYEALRRQAMEDKEDYILERTQSKDYLSFFSRAEDLLELPGVFPAADRDVQLARKLDVRSVRERRRANAGILLDALGHLALFPELREEDCPLFVPILTEDRDALRRHLIANAVYCPVHWPVTPLHPRDLDRGEIYDRELSLVCDQRYGPEDMARVAELVKAFLEKRS